MFLRRRLLIFENRCRFTFVKTKNVIGREKRFCFIIIFKRTFFRDMIMIVYLNNLLEV